MFQFKLSKFTDAQMSNINIDCSYKPYNPYIKLNPDFSGLYGDDWNDSTGLILGGDFSLSILTDAWTDYQLNNKNYQNIFNRQIQNIDIMNRIAREQQQFNSTVGVLTGTIGGGIGGAVTGAKVGGVYGAIGGAAVGLIGGAAASMYGAAKDAE